MQVLHSIQKFKQKPVSNTLSFQSDCVKKHGYRNEQLARKYIRIQEGQGNDSKMVQLTFIKDLCFLFTCFPKVRPLGNPHPQ